MATAFTTETTFVTVTSTAAMRAMKIDAVAAFDIGYQPLALAISSDDGHCPLDKGSFDGTSQQILNILQQRTFAYLVVRWRFFISEMDTYRKYYIHVFHCFRVKSTLLSLENHHLAKIAQPAFPAFLFIFIVFMKISCQKSLKLQLVT